MPSIPQYALACPAYPAAHIITHNHTNLITPDGHTWWAHLKGRHLIALMHVSTQTAAAVQVPPMPPARLALRLQAGRPRTTLPSPEAHRRWYSTSGAQGRPPHGARSVGGRCWVRCGGGARRRGRLGASQGRWGAARGARGADPWRRGPCVCRGSCPAAGPTAVSACPTLMPMPKLLAWGPRCVPTYFTQPAGPLAPCCSHGPQVRRCGACPWSSRIGTQ